LAYTCSFSLSFYSSLAFARARSFSRSLSTCNLSHSTLPRPNFETSPSFSHTYTKSWLPGVGKICQCASFHFHVIVFPK